MRQGSRKLDSKSFVHVANYADPVRNLRSVLLLTMEVSGSPRQELAGLHPRITRL